VGCGRTTGSEGADTFLSTSTSERDKVTIGRRGVPRRLTSPAVLARPAFTFPPADMPLPDDSMAPGSNLVPLPCPMCDNTAGVQALAVHDAMQSVQYWRCGACGFVWATRENSPLPIEAA
jgi:predicted RNA-binding Zn-ribbon protein involved in translation (DUF1610 family)